MNKFTIALLITLFIVAGCGTQTADGVVFKTADPRFNVGFRIAQPPVPPIEPAVVPPTPTEVIHQATAQPEEEVGEVLPDPTPAPPCIVVKANISSDGRKLYHVEGMPNYNTVKIDEAAGERFFCSTADAEAAGWVRAGN